MLLVSGVILYIFPGRTPGFAWEMGGLTKPAWQNQHIIFGFAFSLLSLGHLFLINWHAFLSYLKTKTTQGMKRPVELLTISILSLLVGTGTYFGIQPFSGILEFGKGISRSWEQKTDPALMNHAELMTSPEISQQIADEAGISSRSQELAFRDEEFEADPDTTSNTITGNNSQQTSDVQAPDDELHRRTTKSCSSCH